MYILVEAKTNKIVGTASRAVSVQSCSRNGQKVYEIPDDKFNPEMIGSILELDEILQR